MLCYNIDFWGYNESKYAMLGVTPASPVQAKCLQLIDIILTVLTY